MFTKVVGEGHGHMKSVATIDEATKFLAFYRENLTRIDSGKYEIEKKIEGGPSPFLFLFFSFFFISFSHLHAFFPRSIDRIGEEEKATARRGKQTKEESRQIFQVGSHCFRQCSRKC
jgi:hypothetical protein